MTDFETQLLLKLEALTAAIYYAAGMAGNMTGPPTVTFTPAHITPSPITPTPIPTTAGGPANHG